MFGFGEEEGGSHFRVSRKLVPHITFSLSIDILSLYCYCLYELRIGVVVVERRETLEAALSNCDAMDSLFFLGSPLLSQCPTYLNVDRSILSAMQDEASGTSLCEISPLFLSPVLPSLNNVFTLPENAACSQKYSD